MTNLAEELQRLGLLEYLDVLVAEGFDTWETVSDIAESDLNSLNVKIGHRRKLQRAIAESRSPVYNHRPPIARTKRKYARHPKSDEHAPGRPLSAYVIFANHVRESLEGQGLSFTEIAKVVGKRWQVLPAEAREAYQCQAKVGKEKYHAELAEYKGSPKYDAYQKYLKGFKAKHAAPYNRAERIRSRLETHIRTVAPSSTHEYGDRRAKKEPSSVELSSYIAEHDQEGPSPILSLPRLSGYSSSSRPTSPTAHSRNETNSACPEDSSSLVLTSLGSAVLYREGLYDLRSTAAAHNPWKQSSDFSIPIRSSSFIYQPGNISTTFPPLSYTLQYDDPINSSLNRPFREFTWLPSITHEGRILSPGEDRV
ncbi:hypothetical protein COCVIDRAFT_115390 [Bipolaris victoriae FI3]|uniref:HMG box domain-containing protein n=1 Tax=Bipolaris victoriae (strain FI3) TaxID=930091 RepID=W7E1I4_BIPV3|nr:hypothetical protein COCVIDRAFT_115390 [Bipolaris victoriae FI3]